LGKEKKRERRGVGKGGFIDFWEEGDSLMRGREGKRFGFSTWFPVEVFLRSLWKRENRWSCLLERRHRPLLYKGPSSTSSRFGANSSSHLHIMKELLPKSK
jgi:hypothetical protein